MEAASPYRQLAFAVGRGHTMAGLVSRPSRTGSRREPIPLRRGIGEQGGGSVPRPAGVTLTRCST